MKHTTFIRDQSVTFVWRTGTAKFIETHTNIIFFKKVCLPISIQFSVHFFPIQTFHYLYTPGLLKHGLKNYFVWFNLNIAFSWPGLFTQNAPKMETIRQVWFWWWLNYFVLTKQLSHPWEKKNQNTLGWLFPDHKTDQIKNGHLLLSTYSAEFVLQNSFFYQQYSLSKSTVS